MLNDSANLHYYISYTFIQSKRVHLNATTSVLIASLQFHLTRQNYYPTQFLSEIAGLLKKVIHIFHLDKKIKQFEYNHNMSDP